MIIKTSDIVVTAPSQEACKTINISIGVTIHKKSNYVRMT